MRAPPLSTASHRAANPCPSLTSCGRQPMACPNRNQTVARRLMSLIGGLVLAWASTPDLTGQQLQASRQASSPPKHSRLCPRAAAEMKRACPGGQNAKRSKDALRCLILHHEKLAAFGDQGKRGVYAGVERRDCPSVLGSWLLLRSERQPALPGGWFRPHEDSRPRHLGTNSSLL